MGAQIGQVPAAITRDRDWIRKTFLLAEEHVDQSALEWRLQTLASQKYTDTRLGGNWTINNIPQYTRHADLRVSGLNADNDANRSLTYQGGRLGMGRFYSEQIDDNSRIIHMRFGVPEYNGMLSFFTSFYDGDASTLASEGRASIAYYVGRAIGMVVSLSVYLAFPIIVASAYAARFFLDKPSSKYYYIRPTMALYYNRVNLIANTMAVNMGIVPRVTVPLLQDNNGAAVGKTEQTRGLGVENEPVGQDGQELMQFAHQSAPDIFREGGGIDIYKIANKAQRMANRRVEQMKAIAEGKQDSQGYLDQMKRFITTGRLSPPPGEDIEKYLERYHGSAMGDMANQRKESSRAALDGDISQQQAETPPAPAGETDQAAKAAQAGEDYQKSMRAKWLVDPDTGDQKPSPGYESDASSKDGFMDFWMANRSEGSDFISFRVDHNGTVSESFSNSVGESDIASKINGMSSSARSARFSFSEGNTGIALLDGVKSAVGGVISGIMDSVHISGLLSLAGSALVDIPKTWQSSSASFPTASYTMELRTPYGNKLARYTNLYVPLATLLAAALPLATGKASYTAPYLCQLFDRGRVQIKLGMITSLSISRGEGNMGWNNNNECLGINVSFEVTDLSSICAAPVDSGFNILKPWKNVLDEDTAFFDYMATLGNLSLADQIYPMRQLALNLARKREQLDTFFSKGHFAAAMDNFWPTRQVGNLVGMFVRASERTIQN